MKKNVAYIFLLFLAVACSAKKSDLKNNSTSVADTLVNMPDVLTDTFKTGEIVTNINCLNDASKKFALYVPNITGPLPGVIFLFDAHGDPIIPLNKYKRLADEFKFVLIGSYDSKNGNDWNTTEQIWKALISEKRITYDKRRVYTIGFSGGAKVASYIALNNSNIAGVVANSAGFPETQQELPKGNFSFLGVTGTGDMNMTELVSLNQQLDQSSIKHQLLMFNGKHEWCPEETMRDAFYWFHFNEVRNSINELDKKWKDDFIAHHNKKINRLKNENDLLALADENKLMANYLNGGISDLSANYSQAFNEIQKSPAYQKQLAEHNSLLEREKNIKSNMATALQQNTDVNFWMQNMNELNKQGKAKTADGAMYNRVISYLSLASFSFSNRSLNAGDNSTASKYISLYKIIDPTNPEAYYFSAILNARAKNYEAAKAELQKAVSNGFDDWNRIKAQQEFSGMNLNDMIK